MLEPTWLPLVEADEMIESCLTRGFVSRLDEMEHISNGSGERRGRAKSGAEMQNETQVASELTSLQ